MILDKAQFQKKVGVLALKVAPRLLRDAVKILKNDQFKGRGFRSVIDVGYKDGNKLVLLNPDKIQREEDLKSEVKEWVQKHNVEIVQHELMMDYSHMTMGEVLRQLLPSNITDIPSSFETAGHIAHLNLRDEQLEFKKLIGQVIVDKNPSIRTVVNKVGTIETEFRTFPLEILAGDDDLDVVVKEHGCTFKFNYAKVYWNSRLGSEHQRIVQTFKEEDIIVDGFCGVGPFAIPAAKKGCTVYASDLNPNSYEALVENIKLNRVEDKVIPSNEDGREYIKRLLTQEKVIGNHFLMNLPATAIEFLDAFCGSFSKDLYDGGSSGNEDEPSSKRTRLSELPMVHCYCFANPQFYEKEILDRVEKVINFRLKSFEIRPVRNVSPNKEMYCLHFRVPKEIAFAEK